MKNIKIHLIIAFAVALFFSSCNAWLDVDPMDQTLESTQFSTENNIQVATNGLYRDLVGNNLYGRQLTQTTLEMMGHFYAYPASMGSQSSEFNPFFQLANWNFTYSTASPQFLNIWKSAYAAALRINVYIKNMKETQAVISTENRNLLLGEAYGLRAYLHFDLLRLFGPVYANRSATDKVLPYHNKAMVPINHTGYEADIYSTVDQFMDSLLVDLKTAETLLKENDPIVTIGAAAVSRKLTADFYKNRTRRMNYYAVKGLQARVHQYMGNHEEAAKAAKEVTDQVGSVFNWVNPTTVKTQRNYIFVEEVIFGLHNLDFTAVTSLYNGTRLNETYVVDKRNLASNILGYILNIGEKDVRSYQWVEGSINPEGIGSTNSPTSYRSLKYTAVATLGDTTRTAIFDLQVLMRISEMYYIQAEEALRRSDIEAASLLLDEVLNHRGLTEGDKMSPTPKTEDELWDHIEREYYREFFGEGQVFYYHKRLASTKMFTGYGAGKAGIKDPVRDITPDDYVVPVPQEERDL